VSQFEFFMTFYSLLLGLAVAELLLGFANLLRHRARPKLGLLTPLLGMFVFLQLMATFIDAWGRLQHVALTMDGLALPTGIGVLLFFVSVIVVPRDPAEWTDLDEYFRANRRWAIGLVIAANLLVLGYEAPNLPRANVPVYITINVLGFALMGGAMLLRRRLAIAACLGALILFFLYIYSDFSLAIFTPTS
jgi:hypothetical protein